ncbi:MAG TPA: PP2C family protein-serine/threonine phosphatase [Mycobacteriales bacterium]|nr:PP2C family protein-serine/threonine phosphatase [Mycobacteriales bacterium]
MGHPEQQRAPVAERARRRLSMLTAPESVRDQRIVLGVVLLLDVLCLVLNAQVGAVAFPPTTTVVPVILGGLLLGPVSLGGVIVGAFAVIVAENAGVGSSTVRPGVYIVVAIVAAIALKQSSDRQRLGLSAGRGEAMLLELRDRLRLQGEMPSLPAGWCAEVEQQSAGGASFGGDFLLAGLTDGGRSLELVLVDVSGKGLDAGTRALLLSGALGGLLGSVRPDQFLAGANQYLVRQEWMEGFATALHLTIELATGRYRITNAGHLPAVHYSGGTGTWGLVEPEGTVLGLLDDAEFGSVEGQLKPYDALLLYTDGLVEVPGRDLAVGIDRLLGAAERLIPSGFDGAAQRLLDETSPNASDDRALVLIWRT